MWARTGATSHYPYQYAPPGSEIGSGYFHIGVLHGPGAASHYLYQYVLPGSEIGGVYSHIGVLRGPGQQPSLIILTNTCPLALKLTVDTRI